MLCKEAININPSSEEDTFQNFFKTYSAKKNFALHFVVKLKKRHNMQK